ncbi:MAG TPA: RAMP superfamily CRISPR-associated protein, partial [Tissierellaceae bacterium]|nr:RAMP superfamily CRISPR-associated protein [Tissierellaceae bacterium]
AVDKKKIDPSEVKQALTHVRNFTSIEADGSHKNGSLRQMRVIKKGLNFEVEINYERDLKDKELGLLAASLLQLRHIGTMRTRGKGEVRCSLHVLENGSYRDITADYFNLFLKEVNYNE